MNAEAKRTARSGRVSPASTWPAAAPGTRPARTRPAGARAALTLVAASVLGLLLTGVEQAALAAEPSTDLFVISEQTVTVPAPAPGASETWTFEVAGSSGEDLEVFLRVSAAEGPLFAGSDPARVAVGLADKTAVLAGEAGQLVSARHVPLGTLAHGENLRVAGEVRLPRTAGNEYQGASGVLTLQLATARDTGGPGGTGGKIAASGALSPWWIAASAALLTTAGGVVVARRAKGSRTETKVRTT